MFRNSLLRSTVTLAIALLALPVVACNAPMTTGPDQGTSVIAGSQSPADLKIGDPCAAGEKRDADMDIGAEGGTITTCSFTLVIPASAVAKRIHFHLHAESMNKDHPAYAKFTPEGLQFPAGAEPILTMTTNFVPAGKTPVLVYTSDDGKKVLEILDTFGIFGNTISAKLHHFSTYAVEFFDSGYAVDW